MAEQQQSAAQPDPPTRKRSRQPSYPEMVEEREHYMGVLAKHVADAEERNAGVVASLTDLAEDQKVYLAAMQDTSEVVRAQQRKLIGAIESLVVTLDHREAHPR